MKGEYVEEKDQLNMFAKLHQTQKFQQQQQPLHHHPHLTPHHHHFQLGRESQTSDEPDSPTTATASKKEPNSDGATIEVHRRPRGRPPGSKNKPKQPLLIRDPESSMTPYILEIPLGVDLIDSLNGFSRKRNMGICVLTASGTVANVSLRQPMTPNPAATVTFHGRFDILSLSATILPASTSFVPKGFAISLAGPQGQIVGGTVVGDLVAASTVYVVASSFNNPSFHRLPLVEAEEDVRNDASAAGGGGNEGQSPTAVSGGGDSGHPPSAAAESCGMPMYSCHLPSDVIWTSSVRQQSSPHYG